MKCPVCTDTNLAMSDRQGIEIDYCPECRGVWLDRGELDKLIERSSAEVHQSRPQEKHYDRQRSHDSRDPSHYNKHKKKNLVRELFDF